MKTQISSGISDCACEVREDWGRPPEAGIDKNLAKQARKP